MPHVVVKMIMGRTEEQKQELAERITKDVMEVLNSQEGDVSVSIVDVKKEDWKRVYDQEIMPQEAFLHKKPGYQM